MAGSANNDEAKIDRIREMFGLGKEECKWKNGIIVIELQEGKSELVIERNISEILRTCCDTRIKFTNCIFKKPIKLQQITFDEILYFIDSTFEEEVDFSRSLFKKRVFFSHSTFHKKASFEEVIFEHNAYFDDVKFLGEADFRLSEFYEHAHFYGTMFEKFPNFIQAIFERNLNFEHVSLNFSYDSIRQATEYLYNQNNEKIEKLQIIENISHLIGNIKSSLLERHNILEASQYQKIELYCKELELEHKENSTTRDFIDRIQLYCYRVTSDHHTDLALIVNNIIFLIALFGIISLTLTLYHTWGDEHIIKQINATKYNEIFITSLIFMSIAIYFIFDCWEIFALKFVYLFLGLLLLAIFLVSPTLTLTTLSICSAVLLFVILLLLLMYLPCFPQKAKKNFNLKKSIFTLSYLIVALMVIFKPSLILPILGKLLENKIHENCLFVFDKIKLICFSTTSTTSEALNLIYMLFLFLLLFSLQKTARKNTIVPS